MAKELPRPTLLHRDLAKLFAMIVRNAMEDFHCKNLSDDQMKELNPIIRNALYTGFHMMSNIDEENVKEYYHFQMTLIPRYWEEPELLEDYVKTFTRVEPTEPAKKPFPKRKDSPDSL